MSKLNFPFTEEKIRALKVVAEVLISGVVFTADVAALPRRRFGRFVPMHDTFFP